MYTPASPEFSQSVEILTESFIHYPFPCGCITDETRRHNALNILWDYELKRISSIADIHMNQEQTGCCVCCPLEKVITLPAAVPPKTFFKLFPRTIHITETYKMILANADLEKTRASLNLQPDTEYIYLLGVKPQSQGKGIGYALIEKILSSVDDQGKDAYLETFTEHNRKYYEKFGFCTEKTQYNPKTNLTGWYMVRRGKC